MKMEKRGLSIASMVLGIVCCALCCVPVIAIPCGILAIVFGAIERKKCNNKMAKTGFITGIVGLAIPIVIICMSFLLGILGVMGFTSFIIGLGV